MTTFSGNFALFFRNIFLQNILKKKRSILQKRHLYFWIMVLPNDDVFGGLGTFFSKYFSPKYRDRALESVSHFCSNPFEVPPVAGSCSFLRNTAQISISTNCAAYWQTSTNCTGWHGWWKPALTSLLSIHPLHCGWETHSSPLSYLFLN